MENKAEVAVLYYDPNAYINHNKKKETKKVVFQEPYDCLPKYYIDNNFKKVQCNCGKSPPKEDLHSKQNCNNSSGGFNFNFKNFLPIFSSLLGKNSGGLLSLVGLLGNANSNQKNDANFTDLGGALNSVFGENFNAGNFINIFKNFSSSKTENSGGIFNFFNKKNAQKNKNKTTDFEIKNYTRVN